MILEPGTLVEHRIPGRASTYGLGVVVSYTNFTGLYKVYWSKHGSAVHHVRESLKVIEAT
jgi:hypothetical protein